MAEVSQSLWHRQWFRGCVVVFVALVATVIFIYGYIDWAGRKRWEDVQGMLAREGESLDFRKVAPDPVPDERNFCAISALKDLPLNDGDKSKNGMKRRRLIDAGKPLTGREDSVTMAHEHVSNPEPLRQASFGKPADMAAWAACVRKEGPQPVPASTGNPARDVLAAFSRNDALIGELALGLNRPESQWAPALKTRELPKNLLMMAVPHLQTVMALRAMLGLRAAAAARIGDAAKANQSLLIVARLTDAEAQEPYLIGTLDACRGAGFLCGGVWELCNAHCGSDEQFRVLQEALWRLDLRKSFLLAERAELAIGANTCAYIKRNRHECLAAGPLHSGSGDLAQSIAVNLIPDGWIDANAATMAEWQLSYNIKPLRDGGFRESLARQEEFRDLLIQHKKQFILHLDELFATMFMPGTSVMICRAAYSQCLVNQAIAACALERYRIEHGTYPETLEAANCPGEKSIPVDIISGKPMHYRKTPDGRYALWCVGFDEKDDGGKRVLNKEHPEQTRFHDPKYLGDWVWDFPAAKP
jgi:hypothetical protein